jgi:hypothetical protein
LFPPTFKRRVFRRNADGVDMQQPKAREGNPVRRVLAFKDSAAGNLYLKPPHTIFRMVGRIRLISLVVLLILLPASLKASATPFELPMMMARLTTVGATSTPMPQR